MQYTQISNDRSGPGQVKSYTCSFCKRGFSNAQALGGHMNTHRRDRAKLKQSSEENLLSLEISIKNTIDQEPVPLEEKILFRLDSGEEKHANASNNHKKPFTFPDKDNDHAPPRPKVIGTDQELPHLPSFVGMLTAINEIRGGSVVVQRIEEKKSDLDLELKLGPEQDAPTLSPRENDKKPFTFSDKDNDHAPQRSKVISTAELPSLPSFVGRLTAINKIKAGSVVVQRNKKKKGDLDLELRLGLEPQEAPTLSTIEFF